MFPNSIDNKPLYVRPQDGIVVRDLTQSMFNPANDNFVAYNVFKVPHDFIMRPDLISQAVYNNTIYAEIILKFNSISNPFTINEGDLIFVPELDSAKQLVQENNTSETSPADTLRNSYKYIDPTKVPQKSSELQQFDNRTIQQNSGQSVNSAQNGALPPNIAQPGASQLTFRNGRVYFGDNVSTTCLKNGATISDFLTNVINSNKVLNSL